MSLLNNMLGNAAQGLGGGLQNAAQQAPESLLEQQMRAQLAQQYTSALGQSMVNTKNAVAGQVLQNSVYGRSAFDPNANEAYQIPLSQLVTLWQAKFNDTWVDMGLEHESFWRYAHRRLSNALKFENVEGWVRLLEDA